VSASGLRWGLATSELSTYLIAAPCWSLPPRLEPFGFAPLEANACGFPVVAVAEEGIRGTVVDGVNGLLVEDHPDAIAHAIQRLSLVTLGAMDRSLYPPRLPRLQRSFRSCFS